MKRLIPIIPMAWCQSQAFAWEVLFSDAIKNVDSAYAAPTMKTLIWATKSGITILCMFFLFLAASKLKNEEYFKGFLAMLAAVVTGISPTVAKVFILN